MKKEKAMVDVRRGLHEVPKIAKLLGLYHLIVSFIMVAVIAIFPAPGALGWLSFFIYVIGWFVVMIDFPISWIISDKMGAKATNDDLSFCIYLMIFGTIMWFCIGVLIHRARLWNKMKRAGREY
jgi:hypothetical protein